MEKTLSQSELNELLAKQLKELTEQMFRLENRMKSISGGFAPAIPSHKPHSLDTITSTQPKIIKFPEPKTNNPFMGKPGDYFGVYSQDNSIGSSLFKAEPGKPLPVEVPDFRLKLQRDGLILLGWDWRLTESGGVYTAYWVTSSGVARYYASKPLSLMDFYSASPDHKSYAAEDGIEFYGQKAPVYIVHVAPELMMSNPMHNKLRQTHIKLLKRLGSKVNFDYKYLLKTEKRKKALVKNQTKNHIA